MKIDRKQVKKGAEVGVRTAGGAAHIILKVIGTIFLIGVLTGLFFAIIFASYVKNSLSSELDLNLSDFSLSQTSVIYYWDDTSSSYQVLDELSGKQRRTWVDYENIPEYMKYAAVSIEDKRFYEHHGVDWYRTIGAFGHMFLSMSDTYGGSTITQQLIKNLTQYDDVTVKRKLLEIFRALEFEKKYSKNEIMEWYLNSIYLGEGCWGISSAAQEYFGKDVSELSIAECACIIGITNNPSHYDPYINPEANNERKETILYQMKDQGYIDEDQYEEAMNEQLVFTDGNDTDDDEDTSSVNSWFVDAVIEDVISDLMTLKGVSYQVAETLLYSAGYKIYATVNPKIQAIVDDVYSSRDNIPSGYSQSTYQDLQSAIVMIDPTTGNIVAMSGGMGKKNASRLFNRATAMVRSPGSSIKPIASYGPAIDLGLIMPYTNFYDSADVTLKGTDWYPNNDDSKNAGQVSVRYALQRSINTVAAQIVDELTPEVSFNYLTSKLGMTTLVTDDNGMSDIGYASMALGQLTYGASVREMADAYTALANNGVWTESRTYTRIEDSSGNLVYDNTPETDVAFKSTTAYYMTDMLQNVVNAGTATRAKLENMPAAGKTGASGDWCDRWFVGYTPYYVGAVWCGYDTPEYMGSSNPSTGLWKQVMDRVDSELNLENVAFPIPDGMRQVTICMDTGKLATSACKSDIRGDRTMTLYMNESDIPTQECPCHTFVDVCKESNALATSSCPSSDIITRSVLDLSKATGTVKTPPYYNSSYYYTINTKSASSSTLSEMEYSQIHYVLSELGTCSVHKTDPETGWQIDPSTGYLINPDTGNLYDPETGKTFDPYSGWEIDSATGALIDPISGDLIDPITGQPYVPDTEPSDSGGDGAPGSSTEPGSTDSPAENSAPVETTSPEPSTSPESVVSPPGDEDID